MESDTIAAIAAVASAVIAVVSAYLAYQFNRADGKAELERELDRILEIIHDLSMHPSPMIG